MKLPSLFWLAAWFAIAGLLTPVPVQAAWPAWWPGKKKAPANSQQVIDVALNPAGALEGCLVDERGKPIPKTKVTVRKSIGVVGRATTDLAGRFHIAIPRGGLYQVVAKKGSATFRLWEPKSAPTAAQPSVVLVSTPTIVGGPLSHCKLMAPDACIMAAIVAAAIAIPIAISNSRNIN